MSPLPAGLCILLISIQVMMLEYLPADMAGITIGGKTH